MANPVVTPASLPAGKIPVFVRYRASTSMFTVRFTSAAEANRAPKFAGFNWNYDTQAWDTPSALHVARLSTVDDGQYVPTGTEATIAAVDAARAGFPADMADAVVYLTRPEAELLLEDEAALRIVHERREKEEAKKAAYEASRTRQAAGLELPTGEEAALVVRWNAVDRVFSVRHRGNGYVARDLEESRFTFHSPSRTWETEDSDDVLRLANERKSEGPLAATLEAAREVASRPISSHFIAHFFPTLRVVSTEHEEDVRRDAKTMLHLVGSDPAMIEAAFAAMRLLAADNTDFARRLNDVGFGKAHVAIGHRLATLEPAERTPYDEAFALKLARLHRKQLPREIAALIGKAST